MIEFPDTALSAQTVAVSGPPRTGKYRLFHHLLSRRGESIIVISTATTAESIRDDFSQLVDEPHELFVVDCVTAGRGDQPPDTATTKYVDAPGNLTRIGVKVTEFIESPQVTGDTGIVGVYSLSQLLLHAELDQTYQFIYILSQQSAAEDMPLVAVINDRAHDDQAINALYDQFECLLETRTHHGENQYRARAPMSDPTEWLTL